jgi:hypothetical protein
MKRKLYAIAVIATACSSEHRTVTPLPTTELAAAPSDKPVAGAPCADPIVRIESGVERGVVCAVKAPLTVVDLADAWTPSLFAPPPNAPTPSFRATYLALAAERDDKGQPLPATDALGELYGVLPSLAIVRARLADTARHACHAKIDGATIKTLERPFGQEHQGYIKASEQTRKFLAAQLERARVELKLASIAKLANDPKLKPMYDSWKKLDDQHTGLVAAQRHLVCEGFLDAQFADGDFTWRHGAAIELYQRRNFLMPNERLDLETREAMLTDSRELDFRFALRVLREHVVDATGLIEDGTAGDGPKSIFGRWLDPEPMRGARHEKPLRDGAPDLVSVATEAAARQLGWTGPAETLAFLARHPGGVRVAIALPPVPSYHTRHMELSAEIDRGDIWYDDVPTPRFVEHRPNLTVYVRDGNTKRPLVRWPTTIGGWADVSIGNGVVQKWKESDVGPRVWRDLFVSPTWLPPPATPDRDLITDYKGRWNLKTSLMGPGPRAAYGMVLLEHLQVIEQNGSKKYLDNGIGTHGSASVTSIVNGTSHGCHRLYNQLAVRLADFLLRHRDHVAKGQQPEYFRRTVRLMGTFTAKIDTRGYLYELTPPIPVNVTTGNIKSVRQIPPAAAAPARP